jgi:predicted phosphodiesterase
VWHAGDWGDLAVSDAVTKTKPVRGVYGNIDNSTIRSIYPKEINFTVEGLTVYITHVY